jgi:ParB family chromosome partitioning protein
MFIDHGGKVQTVHFRMPEAKKPKSGATTDGGVAENTDDTVVTSKPRPDVTQTGQDMIGDFRTDALRDALGRAPIEDDTLMALLILAFAGTNVRVDSGSNDFVMAGKRFARHGVRLLDEHGKLAFDQDTLRIAARSMLIDVLSCRRGMSNSGTVARIAGDAIGADGFLPNMGTEEFLLCLSRQALEASCKESSVRLHSRVRDTRAALVEHFRDGHFVHAAAHFAPDEREIADLLKRGEQVEEDAEAPNGQISAQDQDVAASGSADGASDDLDIAASDVIASADDVPEDAETAYDIAAE